MCCPDQLALRIIDLGTSKQIRTSIWLFLWIFRPLQPQLLWNASMLLVPVHFFVGLGRVTSTESEGQSLFGSTVLLTPYNAIWSTSSGFSSGKSAENLSYPACSGLRYISTCHIDVELPTGACFFIPIGCAAFMNSSDADWDRWPILR